MIKNYKRNEATNPSNIGQYKRSQRSIFNDPADEDEIDFGESEYYDNGYDTRTGEPWGEPYEEDLVIDYPEPNNDDGSESYDDVKFEDNMDEDLVIDYPDSDLTTDDDAYDDIWDF